MQTRTTVLACQTLLDQTLVVWYVHDMPHDYYDDDLPEPYVTLAESLRANSGTIASVGKIISVPVGAFLLTCVFNYYVKKKLESLC